MIEVRYEEQHLPLDSRQVRQTDRGEGQLQARLAPPQVDVVLRGARVFARWPRPRRPIQRPRQALPSRWASFVTHAQRVRVELASDDAAADEQRAQRVRLE